MPLNRDNGIEAEPTPVPHTQRIEGDFSAMRTPALIGAALGIVIAIAAGTWLTRVVSRTTPHAASVAALPTGTVPRHPATAPTGLPAYAAPSAKVMAHAQASANPTAPPARTTGQPAAHTGTMTKTAPAAPTSTAATVPAAREHTRPVAAATQPDASKGDWYASLKEELNSCNGDQSGFFARMVCKTRVQNRHCGGHWNTVPECPRAQDSSIDH